MCERLENILSQLQALVEAFDPSGLDRAQSLELYEKLCRGERLMHAAKALAGKHLTDSKAWYQTAHRSPAHFMAATAGTTISHQCAPSKTITEIHSDSPGTYVALRVQMELRLGQQMMLPRMRVDHLMRMAGLKGGYRRRS